MAATNSQGIQILLEAEKEADKIVQKGRACKLQSARPSRYGHVVPLCPVFAM